MMILDSRLVMRTAFWATLLQLILAGAGHFLFAASGALFLFARMMVSAGAGYMYGLVLGQGYARAALGGAIAGGLCMVPGLAVSVLLTDSAAGFVSSGTAISVFTGAVGGCFGQMGAILRKLGL